MFKSKKDFDIMLDEHNLLTGKLIAFCDGLQTLLKN